MSSDLPSGIRRTTTGYQTYVWRKDPTKPKGGYQPSRRWKPDATMAEMKSWLKEQVLRGTNPELFAEKDDAATHFAEDARDYLKRDKVLKMPTRFQREQHIEEWIAIFGRRDRATIEPQQIKAELDKLRARMSAGSVNKRRTALMDLWTTLDGRHQANPVKATDAYEEPTPEPRAPELANVLKLIRGMRVDTEYARHCQARVEVITWTGWPHAMIKQLEPADAVHWKQGRAYVGRRRKGKGARARWLPLLPQAVKALAKFHKVRAYGHFSNSTLHKRVTAACKANKLPRIRPYDLRHFFGTLIATLTQDERVIMELMLVSTPSIIRRYTEAATNPRIQAAVADIVKQLPDLLKAAGRIGRKTGDSVALVESA